MALSNRHRFVCTECGETSSKWLGRCPACDSWDSFQDLGTESANQRQVAPAEVVDFASIGSEGSDVSRIASGWESLDQVLGGGIVPGSAVLLAGEPGIGKSTLMLQSAAHLATEGHDVLYVSAEESTEQLRLRAQRLGSDDTSVLVAGESEIEAILSVLRQRRLSIVMIDSIQAVRSAELNGLPGSMAQVRYCAERLVNESKRGGTALFLVGHVTKEGSIAGPKSLEHLVDTVLTFDGERETQFRLLRAVKNRFGPTGEVALFEMRDRGLIPVSDPSKILMTRQHGRAPGSVVLPSLQGTRPLLVEIQALVNPSPLPTPRRMSVGLDSNRVALLTAVLERFAGLGLADRDLFLNVVGGLSLREPATDLAVAAAILSAGWERAAPADTVLFGEVGLLGEVRPVSQTRARLRAAAALGFRTAVTAEIEAGEIPEGIRVKSVQSISDLARVIRPTG